MPESDRDILIELRTKVTDIHFNMTQPGGKVPQLEATVDKHSSQLAFWRGAVWIIGGIVTLLGGALLEHIHTH